MTAISNKTVDKFVTGFEKNFATYLKPPRIISKRGNSPIPLYTARFVICPGEYKYSDWDVHCSAKTEKITPSVLKQMENFIYSFKRFRYPGLILTPLKELAGSEYHFIDTKTVLQIMAFLSQESFAPFIDVHVEGLPRRLLKNTHALISGQEFINWIMLTYWRKKLNNDPDADDLLGFLPSGCFREEEQKLVREGSLSFFQSYLENRGYSSIVGFLLGRSWFSTLLYQIRKRARASRFF